MAGFFKSLATGIEDIVNAAHATINPFKVQATSIDKLRGFMVLKKHGCLILYHRTSTYECTIHKPDLPTRIFSLFRQTNEVEAIGLYEAVLSVMLPIMMTGSVIFQDDNLQRILDCLRENPSWTCAHAVAFLGFLGCIKHSDIKLHINDQCGIRMLTPLMAAVLGKQAPATEELLRCGVSVGNADKNGDTAYHYAVLNCPPLIALLVDFDKEGVINWLNGKGESALLLACQRQLSDATEILISAGADPRVSAADCLPIHAAIKACDMKSIEFIIKAYPEQANAKDYKYGGTPLHWSENTETVHKLAMLGCDMNISNKEGYSPLHVMMMKKRAECVMSLLCHGSDCNVMDSTGETVLHVAIKEDNLDLVRQFVVFGADVNCPTSHGESPRHLAALSKGKNKDTILYLLHVSGAKRCDKSSKGCLAGCVAEGNYNGVPDQTMTALMKLDSVDPSELDKSRLSEKSDVTNQLVQALFDEQLIATVMPSPSTSQHQGAVFDMVDAPSCKGDRVLCLDGGGIRGLVLIQILMEIEQMVGRPIRECFDWVGGTSTGGILALGIARGYKLSYMKGLYVRLKDEVFKGIRPYESAPFEEMLQREFGEDAVMSDIKHPKVLVSAVLADRFPADLYFFRNYEPTLNHPESSPRPETFVKKKPSEQKIWEAARSSGAAPTYFRGYGPFVDGGLISNNPTLDVITEIHEYNTGLKLLGRASEAKPIGCVISIGTGRTPVSEVKNTDVFRPSNPKDLIKAVSGVGTLSKLIIDQASLSEGRPVDRSRAWCSMANIPYYRFSPLLSEDISLDCHENQTLINMMWETHCYMVANRHRVQELASLLRNNTSS